MMLLISHGEVESKYKNELKKHMQLFAHVGQIKPSMIRWSEINFHRNNNTYKMLIQMCQLVLDGMLLTTTQGEYKLASFEESKEIHFLYERFVLEYYRKEHPTLRVTSAHIDWAIDNNERRMLPSMKSDVMLIKGNKTLIIDTKFYSKTTQSYYDYDTIHSGNLYQIFAYVKNHAAQTTKEVSGMLLYARTDESIQPDETYMMKGDRISVQTLNLNCEFSIISHQLDSIVKVHL